MAEKRIGFGTIIAAGAAVAAVAGGVVAYLKRDELKKLANDILAKVQPTEEEGVYEADLDDDGVADIILADTDGDGQVDTIMMDTDGDGVADKACVDVDGDGEVDVEVDIVSADEACRGKCEESTEAAENAAEEAIEETAE